MTSSIFYMGRPVTGSDGIRMLDHLRVLETESDMIDHLSTTKTDSSKAAIYANSGLMINESVNLFGTQYENTLMKMNSFTEVYNALDVSAIKKYDKLFLMGSACFRADGFCRGGKLEGHFPSDYKKTALSYISHGVHYINILALLKAHREYGIPLHEYAYDTDELSCNLFHPDTLPKSNYQLYYGYDVPEYEAKRLDCTQYFLNKQESRTFFSVVDKDIDFIGGYTNYNDTRDRYEIEMNLFTSKCKTSKVFIKDKKKNINTFLGVDEYNNLLERSKYTMIFPAYDTNVISIDRLIGALAQDCLPIFHSECKLKPVERTFGVKLNDLVIDEPLADKDRVEKLSLLKGKILTYRTGFAII